MDTIIVQLLHVVAALLMSADQHQNELSPAVTAQLISTASRAVQISTQTIARQTTPQEISNINIWPDITRLRNSLYLDSAGKRVLPGNSITLLEEYTSFGDLNGDGLDDAVAVIKKTDSNGFLNYFIAAFVNQAGILFNIADVPLPENSSIYSHRVESGIFAIEVKATSETRKTVLRYKLLGNALFLL